MRLTVRIRFSEYVLLWALLGCVSTAASEPAGDNRVHLHVKASDPNGGQLTFNWVQLDGPVAKILDATAAIYDDNSKKWLSHTYFIPTKAGVYTFQVTVKNEDGLETKKRYVLEAK